MLIMETRARFIMETCQAYYGTGQIYYGNWPVLLCKPARFIMESGQVYFGNRTGLLWKPVRLIQLKKWPLMRSDWSFFFRITNTRHAYYRNLPVLLWKHASLTMETGQGYYGMPVGSIMETCQSYRWNRSGLVWKPARLIMETCHAYYGNRPGLLWKPARFIMKIGQAYYGNQPCSL